jgi:uncharacterized YccA/Bax inhibitor family protein
MSNPVFASSRMWDRALRGEKTFTAQGAAFKTLILLCMMSLTFGITWIKATESYGTAFTAADAATGKFATSIEIPANVIGLAVVGCLGAFVVGVITSFAQQYSPITAPIYACLEGLFLGAISAAFEAKYPGIVMQAMGGVIGTTLVMSFLYSTGILRPTHGFVVGVIAATGGICLLYMADMIMGFFGGHISVVHDNSVFGIILQVGIVLVAALNLIIDFGTITEAAENKMPKWFEWYAAFGLMITIVWLYLEVLKLLAKLKSNDD